MKETKTIKVGSHEQYIAFTGDDPKNKDKKIVVLYDEIMKNYEIRNNAGLHDFGKKIGTIDFSTENDKYYVYFKNETGLITKEELQYFLKQLIVKDTAAFYHIPFKIVKITESLIRKTVVFDTEVENDNMEHVDFAQDQYNNGEIVLDYSDFNGDVEFETIDLDL